MNPLLAAWANFFTAEVGAAAALTGLVVVAISINVSRILSFPHLPGRAAESLVTLVGALVVTSLALVPGLSITLFGEEISAVALVTFLVPLAIQIQTLTIKGIPMVRRIMRAGINFPPGILFLISGARLAEGASDGMYWLAAGIIVALVASVWNSWVLLVEILR